MNLELLTFCRPLWLLALLPSALLIWHLWRRPPVAESAWSALVDAHLLPHLLVGVEPHRRRTGLILLAAALTFAVVALAGPGLAGQPAATYARHATRVVMVDLSAQMAAGEQPAPLERVRLNLPALLRALPQAQTALVVYGDEPYLVVPPTTDMETLIRFIPELAVDAVPAPGNRPERALGLAAKLLARSGSQLRELLWLTAGTGELPQMPPDVRWSVLHAAATADAKLAALASASGGTYHVLPDDGDVRALVAALTAPAGRIATPSPQTRTVQDLGYWLLPPLLLLVALAGQRSLPLFLLVPLLLAGFLAPAPVEAAGPTMPAPLADAIAWQQLKVGAGETAAEGFRDIRWRAVALYRSGKFAAAAALLGPLEDADSHYNRGNALAKQGRLIESLAAFEASLAQRPGDADARHNRDLIRQLLQQQEPPPSGRPPPPPRAPSAADNEREAAQLAQQWLRGVPDDPGSLLRRKLHSEQRRRQAGEVPRPW